ncbi:unnamed protein product [Meganyctiphanes norvegica]|uniref:DM domain-containing protein n=1 Tax=Meganyctiphanes norvegica TaxID=48144 RepID=A0AAV2S6R8_MEGNR
MHAFSKAAAAPDQMTDDKPKKRVQHCQRCENHGVKAAKSKHQCPYKDCSCNECTLTKNCQLYMKHQQRFWRWRKQKDQEAAVSNGENIFNNRSPSGSQRCDRCRNHAVISLKKGHKGKCEFETCTCKMCKFIKQRQEHLKHNQRLKRKRSSHQQVTPVASNNIPMVEEIPLKPETWTPPHSPKVASHDITDTQRLILHSSSDTLNTQIVRNWSPPLLSEDMEQLSLQSKVSNKPATLSSWNDYFESPTNFMSLSLLTPHLRPLMPQPLKPTPILPTYIFSHPIPPSPYLPPSYPYHLFLRKF